MGYAPIGVQGDAIRMQQQKIELKKILKYLKEHPDVKEYKGYTKEKANQQINNIDSFEFLP